MNEQFGGWDRAMNILTQPMFGKEGHMSLEEIGRELGLTFRWSHEGDSEDINKLINKRFGDRMSYGVIQQLEHRYFLALNREGDIVALTGLIDSKFYSGLEIDWTCIHPEYTGHRLMSYMIERVIQDCEQDVYCSCWRLDGKTINLRTAMQHNGFEPVLIPRISYNSEYFIHCGENCKNYNPINGVCKCYEDLYVKRIKR